MSNKIELDSRLSPIAASLEDDFRLEMEDFPTIAEAARVANEKYFAPKSNSYGVGRSGEFDVARRLTSSEGSMGDIVIGGPPSKKDRRVLDDDRINQMAQDFFKSPKGRKFSEEVT